MATTITKEQLVDASTECLVLLIVSNKGTRARAVFNMDGDNTYLEHLLTDAERMRSITGRRFVALECTVAKDIVLGPLDVGSGPMGRPEYIFECIAPPDDWRLTDATDDNEQAITLAITPAEPAAIVDIVVAIGPTAALSSRCNKCNVEEWTALVYARDAMWQAAFTGHPDE